MPLTPTQMTDAHMPKHKPLLISNPAETPTYNYACSKEQMKALYLSWIKKLNRIIFHESIAQRITWSNAQVNMDHTCVTDRLVPKSRLSSLTLSAFSFAESSPLANSEGSSSANSDPTLGSNLNICSSTTWNFKDLNHKKKYLEATCRGATDEYLWVQTVFCDHVSY